jgi:hypothetical protein
MAQILTPAKTLSVNPLKASQPIGASLAFLGLADCMPLEHGARGCASFNKLFFMRHFNEPIPLQTTAMDQRTTVLGADDSVVEALATICKKNQPKIVGRVTTGLSEMQGADVPRTVREFKSRSVGRSWRANRSLSSRTLSLCSRRARSSERPPRGEASDAPHMPQRPADRRSEWRAGFTSGLHVPRQEAGASARSRVKAGYSAASRPALTGAQPSSLPCAPGSDHPLALYRETDSFGSKAPAITPCAQKGRRSKSPAIRLEIEQRRAIDAIEAAHDQRHVLDCLELHNRSSDRIRSYRRTQGESASWRVVAPRALPHQIPSAIDRARLWL